MGILKNISDQTEHQECLVNFFQGMDAKELQIVKNVQTNAESRRDADAEQVLKHHKACGKHAVFRPHLTNRLPAPPWQDGQ